MDIFEQAVALISDFFDPKKRVFLGYLLLSIGIAFTWLLFVKKYKFSQSIKSIFDKRVFFSKSSIADYKIFFVNQIVALTFAPMLMTQLAIATAIFYALHNQSIIPQGYLSETNHGLVVALFSITMFVVDDFTKYLVHRWMHRFPILWAIHKVHHSAESLTPITVYRVHPLEGILYASRSAVAQGIVLSVFFFLFGSSVDLFTVVGVNILVFIFHVTGSNLRHSHISLNYWPWLERILISPAQHQLHHSVAEKHFDKNFGAALAIWDWMFGSLHLSHGEEDLEFGLDKSENSSGSSLRILYLQPIIEIFEITVKTVRQCLRIFPTSKPLTRFKRTTKL
ncbi:MAG: sterol desaturase family protein [Chloroflexota bacterium]